MKVQTDLRAGNVLNDAAQAAGTAVADVSGFFQNAYDQAAAIQQGTSDIWKNATLAYRRLR